MKREKGKENWKGSEEVGVVDFPRPTICECWFEGTQFPSPERRRITNTHNTKRSERRQEKGKRKTDGEGHHQTPKISE